MAPKSCYCINPHCKQPDHPQNNNPNTSFCNSCGSQLLLNGQFRVSRLLSDDSGFGNVYEVFEGFSASILKVLKPQWNNQPKAIELFKREYDVLSQLTKQGIIAIPQAEAFFEYQTRNDLTLYCLVMEKVEGIDLEQWLKQYEKLSQKQALKWLKEIVLILDKIHSQNYFHRDIKPPNIMIRNSGELVLIDFGTAREETQTYYQKVQGKQVTGIISAGYTPIEQQNAQAVVQSDFFALGRTFVHLLTGKQPLDKSMYDGMRDILNWRGHTENIHPLLLDFIDHLIKRIAEDRPQNTKVILQKLAQIERDIKKPQSVTPTIPINPTIPKSQPSVKRLPPQAQLQQQRKKHNPRPKKPQNKKLRNSLIVVGSITLFSIGIASFLPPKVNVTIDNPTSRDTETNTPEPEITPTDTPTPTPTPETLSPQPINYENISLSQTLTGHSSEICIDDCLKFNPDGNILASSSYDDTIKLWDVATGMILKTLSGHSSSVASVAFSPDGRYLATGSGDNTIKLWNVATGKTFNTLFGHSGSVSSVAFSPDGRYLATGSGDSNIKLWDILTERELNTLSGHSDWVNSVAFSPDGRYLATGSDDYTIKLWDISTGRTFNTLFGHSDLVYSVAFSPDGQVLASGSRDSNIKLWDVLIEREINTLSDHSDRVYSVAFSPDGQVLASGSRDKTIKLWDVSTGKELNILSGHSDYVTSVVFSSDGRVLASGDADGIIKLWRVED